MQLSMDCTCSQRLEMHCSVCGQRITRAARNDAAVKATLFGALAYALCACCGQEVSDSTFKSRAYRRRADRWVARRERERDARD
jgi:hypothetical protein